MTLNYIYISTGTVLSYLHNNYVKQTACFYWSASAMPVSVNTVSILQPHYNLSRTKSAGTACLDV